MALLLVAKETNSFSTVSRPKPSMCSRSKGYTPLHMSLATSSNQAMKESSPSRDDISREWESGTLLEGGHVVDFGSVKASSKAEKALAEARVKMIQSMNAHTETSSVQATTMLGINDELIKEVGHEVGSFVNDAKTVQRCAAYLRSKAPAGTLETRAEVTDKSSMSSSSSERREFDDILDKAYEESGEVTGAFAKTFYLGTMLMPEEARRAIWAIYVWCRRTDEIVDAPRESDDEMLTDLSSWEMRLENLWKYGDVEDVLDLPLLDVRIKYPKLTIEPFVDMIRGMLMDVPELGQERYESFDELHLYCYRVAGTVGLMSMPIFGCANGYTEEVAKEPALSLGVAFQLTNILRDIGEDASQRGRIYLPRQDMEKFGVTEEQIYARRVDSNYINLMKFEIQRARMYYDRALRGVEMLDETARLPVQSSLDCYGKILDKIEENGYDSLNNRAYVSKWEKFFTIPFSWYRTQDIAKTMPLPGDRPAPRH